MIINSDSRLLEEYEIIKEVLHITSLQNISHALVKFAFRRRIEYHLTSTFMQVFQCTFNVTNIPYFSTITNILCYRLWYWSS